MTAKVHRARIITPQLSREVMRSLSPATEWESVRCNDIGRVLHPARPFGSTCPLATILRSSPVLLLYKAAMT